MITGIGKSFWGLTSLILILICIAGTYGCHKIDATAGPGGTIAPSGTVWVWNGSNKTFTMTPNAGNVTSDVKVDNASVPIASSTTYTFANVRANHSIAASFVVDSEHYRVFNTIYGTAGTRLDACVTCHKPHMGATLLLNPYGDNIHAKITAGYTKYQSLKLIESADSDADSFNNIEEIDARKFPGDGNDYP